jgi:hypothetical protein
MSCRHCFLSSSPILITAFERCIREPTKKKQMKKRSGDSELEMREITQNGNDDFANV